MIGKEIDEKKTKYFVIAIIILIVLSILLVLHFNNKSLVKGDENLEPKVTTTTTTKKTTTKVKKDKIKSNNVANNSDIKVEEIIENIVEENISKTTIDEENKLIYDYKLSDEITNTDVIKSELLNIDENLKEQNIIKLFDISLYDVYNIKKEVKNTNITISIPITKDIEEYENYKIVYINDNNQISEEEIKSEVENGYIKFTTTHLSKYGIVGTKKIDLSEVTLDIKINDEKADVLNELYVSTEDKIDVIVNNLEDEYEVLYILKDETSKNEYKEFDKDMFGLVDAPSKYTLIIKIKVSSEEKVFEIGNFNIYDIVFSYDKTEEIKEDVIIGEIKNEDGTEYDYTDKEINKDIVIINKEQVETDETTEVEQPKEEIKSDESIGVEQPEEEIESDETLETEEENTLEDTNDVDESEETEIKDKEEDSSVEIPEQEEVQEPEEEIVEDLENKATIKVNGNIYLVEKTDISNLEMTGHLIIDTDEDITFAALEDKLLTSNLYSITIKSKEFSLNGVKYTYEYVGEKLIITKVEDNTEVENFKDIFDGFDINEEVKEDLVLETYAK